MLCPSWLYTRRLWVMLFGNNSTAEKINSSPETPQKGWACYTKARLAVGDGSGTGEGTQLFQVHNQGWTGLPKPHPQTPSSLWQ